MLLLAFILAFVPQGNETLPPVTAQPAYTVVGHGVQIYKCTVKDSMLQWVFQAPEADLFDSITHQPVGTHTAGPTWTWADHSAVTGTLIASQPSPNPDSIPWLLLEAHSTGTPGALANIKFVRRSDTQAGAAPSTGCDAQHQDNVLRVPYEAVYTFYTAP
jgi:hypothetical protein